MDFFSFLFLDDPCVIHASAVVHVTTSDSPMGSRDWIASLRLCTNTKKKWVMASMDEPVSCLLFSEAVSRLKEGTPPKVQYCTMTWTGMSK
ncbi:hypothetical protein HMI54_000319 [Coelomomyces lativittatus]|nr:hypothetical protein HMI55_004277 [Coelomomyces lativittatus]KAJ1518472.1 hypothetical protein HMI54_000319 [Coelomomyces lativittatus]